MSRIPFLRHVIYGLAFLISICGAEDLTPLCAEEHPKTHELGYRHIQNESPQSIHILEVDPHKFFIAPARALNDGLGRETVSSICARCGASAAINGGYFSIGGNFDGAPSGVLKIGSNWYSLPRKQRGAIGWTREGAASINRVGVSCGVRFGGINYRVDGLNQPRTKGKSILYTWAFHRSTLTNPGGTEIAIKDGRVAFIGEKMGDTVLPHEGYVYSIDKDAGIDIERIIPGMRVEITFSINPLDTDDAAATEFWNHCDYIVGGAGLLIRDGHINKEYQSENVQSSFLMFRHPRTAIGIKGDGNWLLVVVDGRQPNLSKGMTILELATLMKSLGCVQALNLDGGGSTTMIVEGNLVNSPIGDEDEGLTDHERRISDAILVFPKT